jgi:hypothetical protein
MPNHSKKTHHLEIPRQTAFSKEKFGSRMRVIHAKNCISAITFVKAIASLQLSLWIALFFFSEE